MQGRGVGRLTAAVQYDMHQTRIPRERDEPQVIETWVTWVRDGGGGEGQPM